MPEEDSTLTVKKIDKDHVKIIVEQKGKQSSEVVAFVLSEDEAKKMHDFQRKRLLGSQTSSNGNGKGESS